MHEFNCFFYSQWTCEVLLFYVMFYGDVIYFQDMNFWYQQLKLIMDVLVEMQL